MKIFVIFFLMITSYSAFGEKFNNPTFYEIQNLLLQDPIKNRLLIFSKSNLLDDDEKKLLYQDFTKSGTSIAIINLIPYLNIGLWANGWWGAGLIASGGQILGTWLNRSENNTIHNIGNITFGISWLFSIIYSYIGANEFNSEMHFMLRMDEVFPISFFPAILLDSKNQLVPILGISVSF